MADDAELATARTTVLDAVRASLRQGGLPLHPIGLHAPLSGGKQAAYAWRSRQVWLGPLAQATERALVLVAVGVVQRIATSGAWASPYLDDHRIRLDLTVELDEIDDQAFRLARARHELGAAASLAHGWQALVDRVAALSLYANGLVALETELAAQADADRAALAELAGGTLATGAARDELATDHVRALADDLRRLTNSATSRRNAT